MCGICMCFLFGCTGRSRSTHYFSVSGDDSVLYDLSGYDFMYEPGHDARGLDFPED